MKRFLCISLLFIPLLVCRGQDCVTTPEDRALAEKLIAALKSYPEEDSGELTLRAARALIGQPYVAGTLEEQPQETLCVYLTRTDCILFVETCLGLARTARLGGGFETFSEEIRQSRYRDGRCRRYEDRLHYTTEWARQAERRGVLKDVTKTLGGIDLNHPVHFMSEHADAYPRMTDPEAIACIEDAINARPSAYIPKDLLQKTLGGILSGDIILFTSATEGLDVAHCGIALAEPGQPVRFIHASTGPMQVVLESRTLEEYVTGRKALSGIQVYRPVF